MSLSGKAVGSIGNGDQRTPPTLSYEWLILSFLFPFFFFSFTEGQGFYLLLFLRCSQCALICISASKQHKD